MGTKGVYNKSEAIQFLRSRLNIEPYDFQEEREIKNAIITAKKRQREIYRICHSRQLQSYSKILQQLSIERVKLKQCWGGAEYFCMSMFKEIAKRNGIKLLDLFCAYDTRDIIILLKSGHKISQDEIKERKNYYCLYFEGTDGEYKRLSGENAARQMTKILKTNEDSTNSIVGQVANNGKVAGKVRLVFVAGLRELKKDIASFKNGEILVTTMTTPSMTPLCRKAAAILTNEGGICSHAAVVSREFKIPCIVGTHNATKVFRSGDLVEVDANQGVVRRIKKL